MPALTKLREKWEYSEFRQCFNWSTNENKGRSLLLLNNFLSSIANVFVTGVFYTSFLALNGIDIVRVGVISFIPYIAWAFSLFSPMILSHFKKRKALLLFNHFFYYACIVLATTIMPLFVEDPTQKTIWFGVFLFLGNVVNALLGSGASAWHLHFIPKDGTPRNVYFSWMNLVVYITSTIVGIGSAMLADALTGSPSQVVVISVLRYIAAALYLFSGACLYIIPNEYPYTGTEHRVRLLDVFTVPLKAKKFMLMVLVLVCWNAFCNVNANTWTYYLINTVQVSYIAQYLCSTVCTVCAIFLQKYWREAIHRFGWFKILLFCILITGFWELPTAFVTSGTKWVFYIIASLQGFTAVGTNLIFANLFYVNLPKENVDLFATFWNFVANISVFVGSSLGTLFISFTETQVTQNGGSWTIFGLPFYGSQLLVWIKCALLSALGLFVWKMTPRMKPDEE